MSKTWYQLYYHLTWSTLLREPLILPEAEDALHRYIGSRGLVYGYKILTVNGMEDHVHVVGSWPPAVSVAEAAQKLKGSSSHFMKNGLLVNPFGWQQGYGAQSVSPGDLDRVIAYVRNQKAHHAQGRTLPDLERSYTDIDSYLIAGGVETRRCDTEYR